MTASSVDAKEPDERHACLGRLPRQSHPGHDKARRRSSQRLICRNVRQPRRKARLLDSGPDFYPHKCCLAARYSDARRETSSPAPEYLFDRANALATAPDIFPCLGLVAFEIHRRWVRNRQIVGIHAGVAHRAFQVIAVNAGEQVGIDDVGGIGIRRSSACRHLRPALREWR